MSKGAVKYDEGKVAFIRGCLQRFPRALLEVARVSAVGCRKYDLPLDDTDFLDVPDGHGRYTDALGRHLLKEAVEGNVSVETGGALPPEGVQTRHDAQVAWNALARLEIKLREEENTITSQLVDTGAPILPREGLGVVLHDIGSISPRDVSD